MVGLAGGSPSRCDIRLGDVVVGVAYNGRAAVCAYSLGKANAEPPTITPVLCRLPRLHLNLITGLRSQYEIYGHGFEDDIKRLGQQVPPTDALFKTSVTHVPTCSEESCSSNPSNLVMRPGRTRDDSPAIFYGTIASGSDLMKDAAIRDEISAMEDVLCFDIAAAKVMRLQPFLIVNGICDYADSHQNNDWRCYAAVTACAYAKDLIRRLLDRES